MPKGSPRRKSIQWFIDKHVFPEPNTGCWLWGGSVNHRGYGKIGNYTSSAHRVIYQHFNNCKLERNIFVLHRCDVPCCVNPDHLFLGTHDDNMKDKVNKGRQRRGSDTYNAILVEKQVLDIVETYKLGNISIAELGRNYNVTDDLIRAILKGKSWKWLTNIYNVENGNKIYPREDRDKSNP